MILAFTLISVVVANFAFHNIGESESKLSGTSIPALINVNKLSTVALNLIQASSYMTDASDVAQLKKRKTSASELINELKGNLNDLNKLKLSILQVNEIEGILKNLEKNIDEISTRLNSLLKLKSTYKSKIAILENSIDIISDQSLFYKIDADSALSNKIHSIQKQKNKKDLNIKTKENNIYHLIKKELYYKDNISYLLASNAELHKGLQVIKETQTKGSVLTVEQEYDHALQAVIKATTNSKNDHILGAFSPQISVLIKHGQDQPDIFNLRIKLIQAENDISLINSENIFLAQKLNKSVNALAHTVKKNTDRDSIELQNILKTSKEKLYAITAFATIVGILLTLITVRHITNPLQKLVQATKEVGNGNLEHKIVVTAEDEFGELANYFNLMIKNLKKSNHQIQYLAYHDALTGLPNRRMFNEFAKSALAEVDRNNDTLAVLFIDLDNFKRVNDTLGHDVGDELLKEISDRLLDNIRTTDHITLQNTASDNNVLARIGGDEFILLLKYLKDSLEAGAVASRLLKLLDEPFNIRNESIRMNASIGISVCPHDADNINDLLKYADIAMYGAKENGKGMYHYYSDNMNTAIFKILTLEKKLHDAIKNDELMLYYQPIVDSSTHSIVGVEALIRWQDTELGLISPDSFIAIAEENGLILPIGEWVIVEACKQLAIWNRMFGLCLSVSVNVSSVQFLKQDLHSLISTALQNNKIHPELLHIEITESILMQSSEEIMNKFHKLKSLGIKLSLDDFGTGYSSLSYLRKYPIDILKIDRQFTNEIIGSDTSLPLVTAIINMAHGLNLQVIAEGVEDQLQSNQLRKLNCDQLQGYLFSRPVSIDQMTELIRASMLKSA